MALYEFEGEQEGDLPFSVGDVITLTNRLGDDWLMGMTSDGRSGMFPISFVRVVVDISGMYSVIPI